MAEVLGVREVQQGPRMVFERPELVSQKKSNVMFGVAELCFNIDIDRKYLILHAESV